MFTKLCPSVLKLLLIRHYTIKIPYVHCIIESLLDLILLYYLLLYIKRNTLLMLNTYIYKGITKTFEVYS